MKLMNSAPTILVLCLFASLLLSGCDDAGHEHNSTGVEGAVAEACTHLANGPSVPITAGSAAAGAPDGYFKHLRVDLSFPPSATADEAGFLTLNIDNAGEAVFVFNTAVTVELTSPTAGTIAPDAATVSGCTASSKVVVFDVGIGQHSLRVQRTTSGAAAVAEPNTVSFVLEVVSE